MSVNLDCHEAPRTGSVDVIVRLLDYGADVTAVVPTRHVGMAKSLGADRVIDYTAEDFTAIGERFDYILDAVGKESFFRCR